MTKTEELKTCRDAFEKWSSDNGFGIPEYSFELDSIRWQVWQAAWNTRPTDGDAERALEAFDRVLSKAIADDDYDVNQMMDDTLNISTALQSTRKPPVDNVKALDELRDKIADFEIPDEIVDEIYGLLNPFLHTSPPVPVDTIAVPREVLQGVRETLSFYAERDKIFYLIIRGAAGEYDVGLAKERLTKALASLDAVFSEGES